MIEKFNKILKNERIITSLICLVLGLTYIVYIYSNIKRSTGFKSISYDMFFWIISFITLFILITIINVFIMKKNEIKEHVIFIILAIVFGIVYLIVAPIQNGSDEVAHFNRIFEVATGQFITQQDENGNYIEKGMLVSLQELNKTTNPDLSIKISELKDKAQIKLNKEEKVTQAANTGASVYSPIVYAPQATGMSLGMLLNFRPLIVANLARIFGFIIWMLICLWAIKIAPSKKGFLLVLSLLPSNITSAVTLSADTILNAFSLLLVAKVFQIIEKENIINIKDYFVLLISSIIIGQCKIAYLPLIFICLLIPIKKYKNKKQYFMGNAIIILATLIFTLIWTKLIGNFYSSTGTGQKEWILANPINYIIVMLRTAVQSFDHLFYGIAAGNSLYQARVQVPSLISFGLMMCLIISLFMEEAKINLKVWKKLLIVCVILAITVLIVTAMYISATTILTGKVGTEIILGAQGRYFIPFIPLLILLFKNKIIKIDKKYLYSTFIMLEFAVILQTLQTFI